MSTAALTKVSMNLTERDIRNTEDVRNLFHVRTNVDAVSAALGITRSLGEMLKNGKELLIKDKSGDISKLYISGLSDE
ncbi:MAG: hypothetical protein KBD83_04445 [Gammaproteobacteria bacterium]|nr:hypothetical protein [Gammaproteobacteria bacterium]